MYDRLAGAGRADVEAAVDGDIAGEAGLEDRLTEPPPRLPDPERVVVPTGRVVVAGGRRDGPGHVGVGERAAGEVLGVDGDDRGVGREVRGGRFVPRRHVELGDAELLDLDAVPRAELLVGGVPDPEIDPGFAEVGSLGDVEGEVEPAELVDLCRALGDHLALGVEGAEVDRVVAGVERQLGVGRCREVAEPPGEADSVARAVNALTVEHVPAQLVPPRLSFPPLIPVGREQRRVSSGAADQAAHVARVERHRGQSVGVGGDRRSLSEHLDVDATDGFAGRQVGAPDEDLRAGDDRIEAEPGSLHHRDGGAVAPVVVILLPELEGRRDPHDEHLPALVERRRQVDVGLDVALAVAVHVDHLVEHLGPVGNRRGEVAVGVVEVLEELRILLWRHRPCLRPDRRMVDGRDGRRRLLVGGIERDEGAIEPDQGRRRGSHVDLDVDRCAERLPVHVADPGAERHRVGRVAAARAADLQARVDDVDVGARQRGGDVDQRVGEDRRIEWVVEPEVPRHARLAVAFPPALDVVDAERGEGPHRVGRGVRGGSIALERRRARTDDQLDRGVGREGGGGPHRHPATFERLVAERRDLWVVRDLLVGGEPQRHLTPVRDEPHRGEHGGRVDQLVEADEPHRFERQRVVLGCERLHGRRRCGELPGHRFHQLATREGGGAGRDRHREVGRLGQAIDAPRRVDLEAQRARPDPAPPAVDRRRQLDGDVERVELLERADGHHRLVERDAEERCELDVALRLESQHLERPRRDFGRWILAGRGERLGERVADDRWRQRLGREVDDETLVARHRPLGQPGEDRSDLVLAQRESFDALDGLCRGGRPVAEADPERVVARRSLAGRSRDRLGARHRPAADRHRDVAGALRGWLGRAGGTGGVTAVAGARRHDEQRGEQPADPGAPGVSSSLCLSSVDVHRSPSVSRRSRTTLRGLDVVTATSGSRSVDVDDPGGTDRNRAALSGATRPPQ